jgi:type I restriction enzyme S subunit
MNDVTLPNGWALATLGEVAGETVERGGPVSSEFVYVDISSIDREKKCIADAKVIESTAAPRRAKQVLQSGDVLVSMTRPNLNAIALVTPEFDSAIGSTGFHVLRSNWAEPKFLFYLVHTREFIEKMCLCVQGALYPAVRPGDIAAYSFPLPSRSEQHRIVARIEELFSELDKGIENLKTAQAQLKVYRQALLKHAFEGKLTAQWREQNRDQLETATVLQQRIQQERAQGTQQQLLGWESSGKRGSKPKAAVILPPLTSEELAELAELPEGWGWFKVAHICDVVRGGSPRPAGDPKFYGGDIPFLKVADITTTSTPYLNSFTFTITEAGLSKTRQIEPNTLLLSNSGATLGVPKICLISATMNDGVAAFLGLPHEALLYHYYFWESKTEHLRNIDQGAAQPNLNTELIKETYIPICSLSEQLAVTQKLEAALSEVDQLDQILTTSLQQAEALRQSVLKRAFSGKLVPQDPHDEPASALLAPIRAELDKASKTKSKGKHA